MHREFRVRSYLAANCISCHQPGASGYGSWDARITTPLRDAGIVNGGLFNSDGDPENRVVKPGSAEHSMLLRRISQLGKDHMPPVATTALNTNAIRLLRDWIVTDLTNRTSYLEWQRAYFAATNAPGADPAADPDGDGAINLLEFLTARSPLDPTDPWTIGIAKSSNTVQILFPQAANRLFEVQVADNAAPPIWQPLDVPGNVPLPASSNRVAVVSDTVTNSPGKLYRVTVREP